MTDNRPHVSLPKEMYDKYPDLLHAAGEVDRLARLDELKHLPANVQECIAELEAE